jgi:hypothetical protein
MDHEVSSSVGSRVSGSTKKADGVLVCRVTSSVASTSCLTFSMALHKNTKSILLLQQSTMKLKNEYIKLVYPPTLAYPLPSLHLSYAGRTAAHINNPTVAPINKNTTASSFTLSL